MKGERSKAWRAILGIALLLLPAFGAYGLYVFGYLVPSLPHIEFPANLQTIDPLKWSQLLLSHPAPSAAFAGAWIKVLIDPLADFFETGHRPLRFRQFIGTILFSSLFTALSYLQICKDAEKILTEATKGSSRSLLFLAYFCAAYVAMTALLDLLKLANAVTKRIP
jgi:hypothetical protein